MTSPPVTVADLVRGARRRLGDARFDPSTREAFLLVGHALGLTEEQVIARDDARVSAEAVKRFEALLARRLRGEPVAYLFGRREFWGREFFVDSRVLVPRPESEHLVEAALELLPLEGTVLDLGTGSGCLAVTLAVEARVAAVAVDRSPAALAVARRNAIRYRVEDRVRFVTSNWCDAIGPAGFDLVVANPPYLANREKGELSPEIADHEPASALFAGPTGLEAYEAILAGVPSVSPRAPLLVEIGAGQLDGLSRLARELGWRIGEVRTDYGGSDRIAVLRLAKTAASRGR